MSSEKNNKFLSTFYFEKDDNLHYPSSHWIPFVDDVTTVIKELPQILNTAEVKSGYSNFYPSKQTLPEDYLLGFQLIWPEQNQGIMLIIKIVNQENQLFSFFPYHVTGNQHNLVINQVTVFENSVEAQIEATLGSASICFYDTQYLINRNHYEAGKGYEFILTGFAYHVQIEENQVLSLTHSDELLQNLKKLNIEIPVQDEIQVETQGASILLPLEDGDNDEYMFSGTIVAIEPFEVFLGQDGWWVDITLLKDEINHYQPIEFKVMITKKIWDEKNPPCIGQDLSGTLWLQGHLWRPHG